MSDPKQDDARIELLGRAAHTIDVSPLDAHLVVETARTQRRRTLAACIAAAAVAVIATGTALAATGEDRDTPQRPEVANTASEAVGEPDTVTSLPAPSTGTKWVGQNGTAVAVPTDWAVTEYPCGVEAAAVVFDGTREPSVRCPGFRGQVTTVRFDPLRDGADVPAPSCLRLDPMLCSESRIYDNGSASAQVTVNAQGDDALEVIASVLDSAITVPDGFTTVPFGWGTTVEERLGAIAAAGLEANLYNRASITQYNAELSPQGGTLVATGTEVTIAPTSAYELGPNCDPTQQTGSDLDVPGPGQPTPAEAVAPYANGLALSTTRFGNNKAEVRGVNVGGFVVKVFRVSERSDGWWPDSYIECNLTDSAPEPDPDPESDGNEDSSATATSGLELLDCPSGRVSGTSGGYLVETPDGYPTREEAVEAWTAGTRFEDQGIQVGDNGKYALILRPDGSAEAYVEFLTSSGYTVQGNYMCIE